MVKKLLDKIRRWAKRSKLLAVSDDELEEWLASLGILERVKDGQEQCFVCRKHIDIDNIQLVSRVEGEIILICNKPECVYHFSQNMERFR